MKKYSFKEAQKQYCKEFMGANDLDPNSDAETVEPEVLGAQMELVRKYMIRYAKTARVPASRAEELVNEVLKLYMTLVETKYSFTIKTILARSLKFFYNKLG